MKTKARNRTTAPKRRGKAPKTTDEYLAHVPPPARGTLEQPAAGADEHPERRRPERERDRDRDGQQHEIEIPGERARTRVRRMRLAEGNEGLLAGSGPCRSRVHGDARWAPYRCEDPTGSLPWGPSHARNKRACQQRLESTGFPDLLTTL